MYTVSIQKRKAHIENQVFLNKKFSFLLGLLVYKIHYLSFGTTTFECNKILKVRNLKRLNDYVLEIKCNIYYMSLT